MDGRNNESHERVTTRRHIYCGDHAGIVTHVPEAFDCAISAANSRLSPRQLTGYFLPALGFKPHLKERAPSYPRVSRGHEPRPRNYQGPTLAHLSA